MESGFGNEVKVRTAMANGTAIPDPILVPGEKRTWLQKNLRPLVGLITVVSCFSIYFMIINFVRSGTCPPDSKELLLIILGATPGLLGFVLQYCFGGLMRQQAGEKPNA